MSNNKSAINRCPICDRLIPECHCQAKIEIIGKKLPYKNKPNYSKDASTYDFEHWCKCTNVLGLNKI